MNYCTIPFSIVMNYCRIPLHRHHGPIQYYIPSLPMNRCNIPFRRYYELLRHHNPIKITLKLRRYKTNWLFDRREDHGGFRCFDRREDHGGFRCFDRREDHGDFRCLTGARITEVFAIPIALIILTS